MNFHIWFYRSEANRHQGKKPLRAGGLLNFPIIRQELGPHCRSNSGTKRGNDERHYLSYEMRLILSLANAVGAAATVRLHGNWSKPISTASIPVPSTTSSNSSPGTRASASSAPRSARRRSSCLQTDQTGRSQRHEP